MGLASDDCVPIPAYKAHAAVEREPNLLYAVSIDYELIAKLNATIPTLLSRDEAIVWDLLSKCGGEHLRKAEDAFVFSTVRKHWPTLRTLPAGTPFQIISARKAIRILHTQPKRTPGIGLRAWGTGASGEVNVHVSVRNEMTLWSTVAERIAANGVSNIIEAVNRRRQEWVYDPEI